MNGKIDFVILWVDGNDPNHIAKRKRYQQAFQLVDEGNAEQSTSDLRFIEHSELRYCLRSIIQHAPWYNKIYIVVDEQQPSFLDPELLQRNRIVLVEHRELFAECPELLPTFNSRAIASRLHKLEGLSEHFLLGNDDVMLSAPVEKSFFFQDDKSVIYADWGRLEAHQSGTLYQQGIVNSAKMVGFDKQRFLLPSHGFFPMSKGIVGELEARFPEAFKNNVQFRFRHESQFLVEALYIHHCVGQDICILRDTGPMVHFSFELCRTGAIEKVEFLLGLLKEGKRRMFCINEYQSLAARFADLQCWLDEICGAKLSCEKN